MSPSGAKPGLASGSDEPSSSERGQRGVGRYFQNNSSTQLWATHRGLTLGTKNSILRMEDGFHINPISFLIERKGRMKAFRTYLVVKDPKRVVLTNVPFSAGQRVEVLMVQDESPDRLAEELGTLMKETQTLPQIKALSETEIREEIQAYRAGR